MEGYWGKYARARATRRRFLGAAGAAGVGAAGLALTGCGDDDSSTGGRAGLATPTSSGAATATVADPFASAKRGGTYKAYNTGDPPSIDPYGNVSFLTKTYSAFVYSRLYKYKAGPGFVPSTVRPTPDLAESAENSPDGLKWTIKLKKGIKFHNLPPVSGRELTADDVKYSWARQSDTKNGNKSQTDFIDKVEYPDASTVVFTLKAPNVVFLDVLADTNLLWIMPTEADGKFDAAKTSIGTGPWMLDNYTASVGFKFKKNPDWYVKGFPLFDGVDYAIIPEYANQLAQFRAGSLDYSAINASDLVDTKKQISNVQLYGVVAQQTNYVFFDSDPASPWAKDERVRQAVSMSFDRDALTDLGYEVKKLQAAGIDSKGPWNNIIPAGMLRFWLDPQGKDAGETAKFFKYDPAEAKKLLSAAGFADNINVTYQYTNNRYGKTFSDLAEATNGYLNQVGIKTTVDVQDYNSKYFTQTFVGNFKGIAFGLETPFSEAGPYAMRLFTDNPNNHSRIKDPVLEKLARDQQSETNEEKRKGIFWDIQRENAKHMYYVPSQVGAATTWVGHQPWMKNAIEYATSGYGAPSETFPYRWSTK